MISNTKPINWPILTSSPSQRGIPRCVVPSIAILEFIKIAEEAKIALRNIRRDTNESLKKIEKSKEISEDDRKKGEDEVQKITDQFIKNVDTLQEKKEKELLQD